MEKFTTHTGVGVPLRRSNVAPALRDPPGARQPTPLPAREHMASEARWTRGSGLIHPHVLCSNCGHARADACPAQAELLSDRAPGHVRRQGETVDLLEMFCHASAAGRPYRPDIVRGFAVRPGVPYLGVRGLRVGRAVDDERGRRDVADDGGPVRLSACPACATELCSRSS